jgi:hypothetical protein
MVGLVNIQMDQNKCWKSAKNEPCNAQVHDVTRSEKQLACLVLQSTGQDSPPSMCSMTRLQKQLACLALQRTGREHAPSMCRKKSTSPPGGDGHLVNCCHHHGLYLWRERLQEQGRHRHHHQRPCSQQHAFRNEAKHIQSSVCESKSKPDTIHLVSNSLNLVTIPHHSLTKSLHSVNKHMQESGTAEPTHWYLTMYIPETHMKNNTHAKHERFAK